MIKVIVAGSRHFTNYGLLRKKLDFYLRKCKRIEIVSGTAKGSDSLGERYAITNSLSLKRFPAKWNKHGKKAGYIRNRQMARYADACIIFWDGKSSGSKHMIEVAKQYNLQTRSEERV